MLSELNIRNVAVIKKARIPFNSGLNVITGETGAGKTILVSSIDAVLGERTSRDLIRAGEEKAQITALFEKIGSQAKRALAELGYEDDDDSLIITREITITGKSTCRINDTPVTVSALKELAPYLIHIHGQRDTLQLLEHNRHLQWIDLYAGLDGEQAEYRFFYDRMRSLENQLREYEMDEAEKAQRMDMLRFQVDEIESASLEDPEEEELLHTQRKLILGGEKVRDGLVRAYQALRGADSPGAIDFIDEAKEAVSDVSDLIGSFSVMEERIEGIGYDLAEYAAEIRETLEELELDPQELETIERRLDIIYRLKKKYGGSIPAILEHYENAALELARVEDSEHQIEKMTEELEYLKKECFIKAKILSEKRRESTTDFLRKVKQELIFLDMSKVELSVRQDTTDLTPVGVDDVEFLAF